MTSPFITIHYPALQFVGDHISYPTISSPTAVILPPGANGWLIQALGQNVRIKLNNGNLPAANAGFELRAGDIPVFLPAPNAGYFFYVVQVTATASFETQPVSQ